MNYQHYISPRAVHSGKSMIGKMIAILVVTIMILMGYYAYTSYRMQHEAEEEEVETTTMDIEEEDKAAEGGVDGHRRLHEMEGIVELY